MPSDSVLSQIQELCDIMDMELSRIHHVILKNGMEFVGEWLQVDYSTLEEDLEDPEYSQDFEILASDQEIVFSTPLRISQGLTQATDGEGFVYKYFSPYSPFSDDPFATVNYTLIESTAPPTSEVMLAYLKNVQSYYFGEEDANVDADIKLDSEKDNVVDFSSFLKRKNKKK